VIDRTADWHTHSDLTDGTAPPELMADAAAAAGLRTWGISDHVRADSAWVPEYVARIRGLRRDGLRIRCGVEAKILDTGGSLDLPASLAGLDYVLVSDHQFPAADGPISPRVMGERIAQGAASPSSIVDALVDATAAAVGRAPFRPIVAHLFSLLPKMGISEELVGEDHLHALAAACRGAGASVEANEKWRCPSPRVLRHLRLEGVPLTAGSDAHRTQDVGRWLYLDDVDAALMRR
jgi:putative hydrolase